MTRNGLLVHFKPGTFETEFYPLNYPVNYPQESPNRSYPDLIEDPRGFLWIGWIFDQGKGGVLKFDLRKKELSFIKQLEKFNISSLCIDDGILWCATNGQGLIRYDTKTDTKSFIGTADGLLTYSIQGLEQDTSGNLWLSTPSGLTRYNPKKKTFNHYFKEDGFFTNNFTYSAHSKSKNGEMIFGSLHGVITFYPDSIKTSGYIPPLVLTDLKIQNESIGVGKNSPLKKNISVSNKIELAHDNNDLTITFASLDFNHPDRIKYSFYLENFEENWREPGLEHTAYYTNLDPGDYIFKVKGTNSDGVWNETGASLKIIILPPWWETWWAYTIYITIILGLIYFLRRYELNRKNLKHGLELERFETEKYQEIDRMKSRFFANISHEFRTPLTLIKGPIQQMISGEFTGNIKKQYQIILRNTNRLMQLINQLLDLSKLDSGEMVLRTSPEDIVSLINGLTQSFESLAKQKNIELQFQSSDKEVTAYIDRDKFEKIVINLLSNAFKFTPEGGFVSVKISSTFDKTSNIEFAKIKISNSGEGISSDKLDKIFDRFYQADDSSVRNYEGTGIGLSLTKELVELHHGKIKAESEPGKVTTLTVYLPLGKKHLHPEEILETPTEITPEIDTKLVESTLTHESETGTTTRPTVKDSSTLLIVEDNADMRNYMRESLESSYKIIEAENGEEGIQQSLEHSPDMIISDVMMPKMDGFQFCTEIKKDERTSHIPVILLTAKASGESKIEGLETGADDYLTKPFDTRELLVRIKNLIEQRKRLQKKFQKEFTVSPGEITVTSIDERLVQKAIAVVEKNISDPNFDTVMMAKETGISRTLLNTKLKALTGLPTGEFIRTLRLKRAAQLLQKGYGNVTQVAYDVGFQNLSYFAKAFRKQFGQSPSHYSTKKLNNPKVK
ncbi:MAG: response regulator [Ignavibacteriaceae bacterium]